MAHDDIFSQEFYNYTDFQTIHNDDKTYALYDALYGITSDFDYRLYLFEPLLTINYSGENLFLFKKLGGDFVIKDNTVLYSYRNL